MYASSAVECNMATQHNVLYLLPKCASAVTINTLLRSVHGRELGPVDCLIPVTTETLTVLRTNTTNNPNFCDY